MNKLLNKELLNKALDHSSAQIFAIFSGIFVIFSLQTKSKELILVAFLTLIYVLIAHQLTVLRKHDGLGDYAVGNNLSQGKLFTIIYHLYFAWWAISIGAILICFNTTLSIIISWLMLILSVILTVIWFYRIFKLQSEERNKWNKNYRPQIFCKNCYYKGKVKIETGVVIENRRCPICKTKSLINIRKKWLSV